MTKKLIFEPKGWACTLEEAEPGHILIDNEYVGFKSEYRNDNGSIEAFNEVGEYLCIKNTDIVQPLEPKWELDE